MHIQVAVEATQELWNAFQRLVPQLTSNHPPPSLDDLRALVRSETSTLVVARQDEARGAIVGAACLALYRVPTGLRAVIEDVVVDASARRRGVGEALVRSLLEIARQKGAASVALTSNPGREAANRLYQRLGFTQRHTNVYVYRFGEDSSAPKRGVRR